MKKIYAAVDLPDAHIVLNLLINAKIHAIVLNENARGGMGEIPFTQVYPEVWITKDSDFDKACEIVETYQTSTPKQKTVNCPACNEKNPINFEICWQCGHELNSSNK